MFDTVEAYGFPIGKERGGEGRGGQERKGWAVFTNNPCWDQLDPQPHTTRRFCESDTFLYCRVVLKYFFGKEGFRTPAIDSYIPYSGKTIFAFVGNSCNRTITPWGRCGSGVLKWRMGSLNTLYIHVDILMKLPILTISNIQEGDQSAKKLKYLAPAR